MTILWTTSSVMRFPYAYAVSLVQVDPEALWAVGFRGMIVDVDNTLLGFDDSELAPPVLQWIATAQKRGFRMVILSNNFPERVAAMAARLGCPGIPNALKPLPFAYWRALRLLGLRSVETVMLGDQLMTDILGAQLLGIRGILLNPIAQKDFPLTRVLRCVESWLVGGKRPQG